MSKIKKFLSVVLSLLLLSMTIVGCKSNNPEASIEGDEKSEKIVSTYGKHDHNFVTNTSRRFINNSKSEYVVVIPSDMPELGEYALSELKYFIKLATGCDLKSVYDTETSLLDQTKYISLGKTKVWEEKKWDLDATRYKTSGFNIKSDNGNVYIYSSHLNNDYSGVLCGVYEFLKHTIGLEIYTEDIFEYNKSKNIMMPDFDIEEIPDFDKRRVGGVTDYNAHLRLKLHLTPLGQYPMTGHSQVAILKESDEWTKHSDWLGSGGTVLCFSAWQTGMDEEFAKNVIGLFEKNPNTNECFMGVPDTTTPCSCERCIALQNEYNTGVSGIMIIFLNKVIERVLDYFAVVDPDRVVTFGTFAYEGVVAPPCKYNDSTGKWVPDAPEVVPHEKLSIQFAPIGSIVTKPLTHADNVTDYMNYLGWASIASDMKCFMYDYLLRGLTIPNPLHLTLTENARLFAQGPMTHYFSEFITPGSAFYNLQRYVFSKMLWDVNYDYNTLAEKFIAFVYGDAAPAVQDYYDYWMVWSSTKLNGAVAACATPLNKVFSKNIFNKESFAVWNSTLEEAYSLLDNSECDVNSYNTVKSELDMIYFSTNINYIEVYYTEMTKVEKNARLDEMEQLYHTFKYKRDFYAPGRVKFDVWFKSRR